MGERIFSKVRMKAEEAVKTFVHKATPVVKREVAKSLENGAKDVKDTVFKVLAAAGTAIIFADFCRVGNSEKPFIRPDGSFVDGMHIVYNEINNPTYNYYK